MSDIIDSNTKYWDKGYYSPNLESYVFRFYGRILKPDFNMPYADRRTNVLDFGCGQGAAVNYFNELGFSAYGCDSNKNDIGVAKDTFPKHSSKYFTIPSDTLGLSSLEDAVGVTEQFDVITSCQSLYYLPKVQFKHFMNLAYQSLKKGGILFATMMTEKEEEYFNNSRPYGTDGWMREVSFKNDRYSVSEYFMHFVKDKDDLLSKFELFEPLHVGEYMHGIRSDEGNGHHFTFCGIKR